MAITSPDNVGSRGVMEKIGMSYVEAFEYKSFGPAVRYRILRPTP